MSTQPQTPSWLSLGAESNLRPEDCGKRVGRWRARLRRLRRQQSMSSAKLRRLAVMTRAAEREHERVTALANAALARIAVLENQPVQRETLRHQ